MGFFKKFFTISDAEKARRKERIAKRYPNGWPPPDNNYNETDDPYSNDDDPNEDLFYGDLNHVDLNHNGIPDIEEEDESDDDSTFGGWNGWDDDDDDY